MPSKPAIHPAAEIFPMMDDETFQQLKADIAEHGQHDPVIYLDGKILDGRNRYRACDELGIEQNEAELSECDDPIAYVMSHNLHRRHLTQSQRAICAAKAREYYEERAKERQRASGGNRKAVMETLPEPGSTARDEAGAVFGVSGRSVDKATVVVDGGCKELVSSVESGAVSVNLAERFVREVPDKKHQREALKGKDDPSKAIKDYLASQDEVDDTPPGGRTDVARTDATEVHTEAGQEYLVGNQAVEPLESTSEATDGTAGHEADLAGSRIEWVRVHLHGLLSGYLEQFGDTDVVLFRAALIGFADEVTG